MTDARARAEQRYLRAHGKTTEFRERVMQFLFRRYASWNVGENGSFMNRTSFRQCCRELELVGRTRRFVTGDIEVCFADGLLSAIEGAEGNVAGRSLGHQRRGQTKRRPLLNYRQFVMAMQGIAIKLSCVALPTPGSKVYCSRRSERRQGQFSEWQRWVWYRRTRREQPERR